MTLTAGINSYISLAAADELAASRLFTDRWMDASDQTRATALLTATALLDRMQWQGRPVAPTQRLAWPRIHDRCPPGYPLATDTPAAIVTATAELAFHLVHSGHLGGGPAVMQQMVGASMVMHFAHVADELPKHVRRLIEPFLRSSSANVAEVRF